MFPCTVCGECCRQVSLAEETRWLDRGDGACRNFDEQSNLCKIYDERPLTCRVDEMFDAQYHKSFTRSEFYRVNAECCNIMQEKAGLDCKFRINIDQLP